MEGGGFQEFSWDHLGGNKHHQTKYNNRFYHQLCQLQSQKSWKQMALWIAYQTW